MRSSVVCIIVLALFASPAPAAAQILSILDPLLAPVLDLSQVLRSISWKTNCTTHTCARTQAKWYKWALLGRTGGVSNSTVVLASWWLDYKKSQGKAFASWTAESTARNNWLNNLEFIANNNDGPSRSFWLGPNEYLDRSMDTLKAKLLMQTKPLVRSGSWNKTRRSLISGYPLLPTGRDWKWRNKVPAVKNQGMCGSCWAFAASLAVESAYMITFLSEVNWLLGSPINLSEQHLLDCDAPEYGGYSNGCDGGFADTAMDFAFKQGQATDDVYPYKGTKGICSLSVPSGRYIKLGGAESVTYPAQNDPLALMQAVDIQPVVVYVEASPFFMAYSGGMFDPTQQDCGNNVNHAVTIVGYQWLGDFAGSYWLIQNSWGTSWGDNGLMRMAMQPPGPGPCGMYQYPMAPSLRFAVKLPLSILGILG